MFMAVAGRITWSDPRLWQAICPSQHAAHCSYVVETESGFNHGGSLLRPYIIVAIEHRDVSYSCWRKRNDFVVDCVRCSAKPSISDAYIDGLIDDAGHATDCFVLGQLP